MVDYAEFRALAPFIKLVEDSLAGLADGDRYFDLFADDVVMEFVYAPRAHRPSSGDVRRSSTRSAATGASSPSTA